VIGQLGPGKKTKPRKCEEVCHVKVREPKVACLGTPAERYSLFNVYLLLTSWTRNVADTTSDKKAKSKEQKSIWLMRRERKKGAG